jgi:hypothetical protein
VAALRRFGLVEREIIANDLNASLTTDAIRLHRLVRGVMAARIECEMRDQLRRRLIEALAKLYPADAFNDPTSWPRCRPLTPHLLELCDGETADAFDSARAAELLNSTGNIFTAEPHTPTRRHSTGGRLRSARGCSAAIILLQRKASTTSAFCFTGNEISPERGVFTIVH